MKPVKSVTSRILRMNSELPRVRIYSHLRLTNAPYNISPPGFDGR